MIGKIVTVTVDRPIGSCHPDYPDMIYPINYGYVKGVMAADGEEQDAYIIGIDSPISEFTGRVIAVIRRTNDVEDKLVVAPEGVVLSKSEIINKTRFQEKFFDIKVELSFWPPNKKENPPSWRVLFFGSFCCAYLNKNHRAGCFLYNSVILCFTVRQSCDIMSR